MINWKKIDIKNRACYYFYDIIKLEYFDFDDNFNKWKILQNILVYDVSYKTLIGAKQVCIRFDKLNG